MEVFMQILTRQQVKNISLMGILQARYFQNANFD